MGHLVERAPCVDGYLRIGKRVEHSAAEEQGVEEHGKCAEDDHRAHGNGRLVGFAAHHGFRAQHCGGTADGTSRGGEKGGVAVELQHLPQNEA